MRDGACMGPIDGNASLRFASGPRRSSRPLRWHGRTSMPTMSLVSFQRRFGSSVDNLFLPMLGEKKLPVVWLLGLDGSMVLHPRLPFLFHGRFEKETEREDVPFRIPIDQLSYGSTPAHPAQTKRGTKAIVDTSKRTSTGGGETQRWPHAWWKKRR